jgi:hypothetical protein
VTSSRKPHHRRFENWCRLGGEPLITLARLVEDRLVPLLIESGFEWAETYWTNPDEAVGGGELNLVRRLGDEVDDVMFNFDKYRRPAFQVHLMRREAALPYAWVRSANLVRQPSQLVHFWGKPSWLPARFWTGRMSERTVDRVGSHVSQALAFLENGTQGSNVSRRNGA